MSHAPLWAGTVAQLVACVPSMAEVPGSSSSPGEMRFDGTVCNSSIQEVEASRVDQEFKVTFGYIIS